MTQFSAFGVLSPFSQAVLPLQHWVCHFMHGATMRLRLRRTDVPKALELCAAHGLTFEMMETSFFLSRDTVVPVSADSGMALWREKLFAFMQKLENPASTSFGLPSERVVELGVELEI